MLPVFCFVFSLLVTDPSQHSCVLISFMSCCRLLSGFGFSSCGNRACASVLHSPSRDRCVCLGVVLPGVLSICHLIRVVKHTCVSSEQTQVVKLSLESCFLTDLTFSWLHDRCLWSEYTHINKPATSDVVGQHIVVSDNLSVNPFFPLLTSEKLNPFF